MQPSHAHTSKFERGLGAQVKPLLAQMLVTWDAQGLIGREMFAIDGVKLSGNAIKEHGVRFGQTQVGRDMPAMGTFSLRLGARPSGMLRRNFALAAAVVNASEARVQQACSEVRCTRPACVRPNETAFGACYRAAQPDGSFCCATDYHTQWPQRESRLPRTY